MKGKIVILCIVLFSLLVIARNTQLRLSVEAAKKKHTTVLKKDIQLYWHGEEHPVVVKSLGTVQVNKKTNAFGKSDIEACDWVLHSSLKSLQAYARKMGGNAVINICSNTNRNRFCDEEQYECLAGTTVAKNALVGEVVILGTKKKSTTKSSKIPGAGPQQTEED